MGTAGFGIIVRGGVGKEILRTDLLKIAHNRNNIKSAIYHYHVNFLINYR